MYIICWKISGDPDRTGDLRVVFRHIYWLSCHGTGGEPEGDPDLCKTIENAGGTSDCSACDRSGKIRGNDISVFYFGSDKIEDQKGRQR